MPATQGQPQEQQLLTAKRRLLTYPVSVSRIRSGKSDHGAASRFIRMGAGDRGEEPKKDVAALLRYMCLRQAAGCPCGENGPVRCVRKLEALQRLVSWFSKSRPKTSCVILEPLARLRLTIAEGPAAGLAPGGSQRGSLPQEQPARRFRA